MGLMDDPRMKKLADEIHATPTGPERNKLTEKQIKLAQTIWDEEKKEYLKSICKQIAEMGECNFTTNIKGWKVEIKARKETLVEAVLKEG